MHATIHSTMKPPSAEPWNIRIIGRALHSLTESCKPTRLCCRAQCQKDPSLLAGIVKPVKGTVTEKLMDDSAHLGKISPHSDPEALPAGLGVATPGFYGGDGEHKQLPYVYT